MVTMVIVRVIIHTTGKHVQIMQTFLILSIAIIWCHFFTKLTGIGKNAQHAHF
jgi:hypothetical protein